MISLMDNEETIQVLATENGRLQERVNDLQAMSAQLSLRIDGLNRDLVRERRNSTWRERFGTSFGVAAALFTIGLCVSPIVMWAFAQKTRDCYVEQKAVLTGVAPRVVLKRTIDWGEDRTIGEFTTLEEAVAKAKVLGCKVE